ncbi:MAG: HD domain-containing protein [Anaerolineales bacterium]|nr:HD domain-containing protein [Anaerolineales bacterium]
MTRAGYRVRQFISALTDQPTPQRLARAAEILTPAQLLLFRSLPVPDQAHALRVLEALRARGEDDPLLLAAALLHDVGKVRCPLTVWERAIAVLVGRLAPQLLQRWGRGRPTGWRRPFVAATQHPGWGAEMLAEVGAPRRLVALVRHHQVEPAGISNGELIEGLRALRTADDRN